MSLEIPLIPEVPEPLRQAAQLGTLIPFVGAGVSALAGCPNWDDFANGALNVFVARDSFTHAQLDQVKSLNPRIKLSIALALQAKTGISINFRQLLHRNSRNDHPHGRRLYSHLSKLGKTFVTTNYDEWLDDELSDHSPNLTGESSDPAESPPKTRTVYYKPHQLTSANLNQENVVIHLHGSVKDSAGMILTTADYVQHYANDRRSNVRDPENYVLTFLEHLFEHKTVLFVGYGLEELEILEYIVVKARTTKKVGLQPNHFLLQGFFSHEQELMVSMRTYYHECGIQLMPFLKDHRGWAQLIDVLESFARSVPASTLTVLQQFKEMEALLNG